MSRVLSRKLIKACDGRLFTGLDRAAAHYNVMPTDSQTFWARWLHQTTPAGATLSEQKYQHLANETLERLQDALDEYVEDKLDFGDVRYEDGVLTVSLGEKGTYVLNKQAPNRQIWSSSPVSGPVRYDWVDGKWIYSRDGHDMHQRLSEEITRLCGATLDLSSMSKT